MPTYQDAVTDARQKLAADDAQGAFSAIRWTMRYPAADLSSDGRWQEAFGLFSEIAVELAGEELARLSQAVAESPSDARADYELGYALVEAGLPEVASTVLARAHALEPDVPNITTELAAALEASGSNSEAVRFLREAGPAVAGNFVMQYLLAFNTLMIADVQGARALVPGDSLIARGDPDAPTFRFMRANLCSMLDRAEAIRSVSTLDDTDVRGWHFVVNGALLLSISPFGFDEGMRGRYAYLQDTESNCLAGIRRLEAVLQTWRTRPERIFVLPERGSTALALAASRILQIPVEPWPAEGSTQRGLIVAYDLDRLDPTVLESLAEHRPGQLLWSHITRWTHRAPVVADLTTCLAQINVAPWDERMRVSENSEPTMDPASDAPEEELAADILSAALSEQELAGLPELQRFAEAFPTLQGSAAAGAFVETGPRRLFRTDSPVKSNRFL